MVRLEGESNDLDACQLCGDGTVWVEASGGVTLTHLVDEINEMLKRTGQSVRVHIRSVDAD